MKLRLFTPISDIVIESVPSGSKLTHSEIRDGVLVTEYDTPSKVYAESVTLEKPARGRGRPRRAEHFEEAKLE